MTNTNGFDDFDTQVTAEEFYAGWTEDEADYHAEWREEQVQEDANWRDLGEMDTSGSYSYELLDDGDALASAGFGTDEDYGYYGEE